MLRLDCNIKDTNFLKAKTTKDLKQGPKNFCVINFENNGFDKIHICSIFSCKDVILQLPEPLQTD